MYLKLMQVKKKKKCKFAYTNAKIYTTVHNVYLAGFAC